MSSGSIVISFRIMAIRNISGAVGILLLLVSCSDGADLPDRISRASCISGNRRIDSLKAIAPGVVNCPGTCAVSSSATLLGSFVSALASMTRWAALYGETSPHHEPIFHRAWRSLNGAFGKGEWETRHQRGDFARHPSVH